MTAHWPRDGLIQADDGRLYGTTYNGGGNGGVLYRMDLAGTFASIHDFCCETGYYPMGGLLQASDGKFYGATYYGGSWDRGVLYSIDPSGENPSSLREFSPWDWGGTNPYARLIEGTDGSLYGTAGVVFRLAPGWTLPAISGVWPSSGSAGGGSSLRAEGSHFRPSCLLNFGGEIAEGSISVDSRTILALAPPSEAGTLSDVLVQCPDQTHDVLERAWFADFLDVDSLNLYHDHVESIVRSGITAGCGSGSYCPASAVTRAQMAVFLLKAEHGSAYLPPPCTGVFSDTPCPGPFTDWVERLAAEGVTGRLRDRRLLPRQRGHAARRWRCSC